MKGDDFTCFFGDKTDLKLLKAFARSYAVSIYSSTATKVTSML
jgi:hypothetical protein